MLSGPFLGASLALGCLLVPPGCLPQSINPSINPSIHHINPSIQHFHQSINPSIYQSISQPINQPMKQSINQLSINEAIKPSIKPSIHLFIFSSFRLPPPHLFGQSIVYYILLTTTYRHIHPSSRKECIDVFLLLVSDNIQTTNNTNTHPNKQTSDEYCCTPPAEMIQIAVPIYYCRLIIVIIIVRDRFYLPT